MLYNYKTVMAQ